MLPALFAHAPYSAKQELMDLKPYFDTLELPPEASLEEVRQAYKDLVNVWHPDRFAHMPRLKDRAEKKLKAINAAYEILISRFEAGGRQGSEPQTEPSRNVPSGGNENRSSGPKDDRSPWKSPPGDKTEAAVELGTRIVLTACYSAYKIIHHAVSGLAARAEREAALQEEREKRGR